jgi:hypothetical protein
VKSDVLHRASALRRTRWLRSAKKVIAVKKPPKKAPPQPVIGAPALGQVHRLGPPPHDLVAVNLEVSPPDIAPQFKPRTPPAAKEAAPPAKKKRKQRVGRQGVILDGLLQKLQREGLVTGRATSQIHGRVANRWAADSGIKTPSRDTVARHLGRRKN